ncbi:hypothetical protein D9Q98_002476 [Chlorella vulgaris]|uniref:Uncharacterized protein n=1 Tax=Chlorella vulgaris TaxID=3077 RepID=A0A9D4TTW4_CHLVU|nr:hypothetical protein D9Q98_002476 [Chlorella vulgaris]
MRRYVEPPPRLRVLDFTTGSTQDRFALPKASIVISTDGKRMLGMQERSSVKVLRYAADAAAAAASAAAQDRQMATPRGRRHSAYHRHLEVMRRQEQQQCVDAVLAGSIARSAAAARKALMSGSGGVRGCLVWHTERQEGEDEDEAAEEADVGTGGSSLVQRKRKTGQQSRPGTAPAAATAGVRGRLGVVRIWSQAACEATSPRFKARAAFEQRRAATPDSDAIRRHGYLQLHKQRRVTQAAREAREAELAATWPHGLPKAELRRALAAGLRVVGVGVGGNPLSLQRSTYLSLRPGMRWY